MKISKFKFSEFKFEEGILPSGERVYFPTGRYEMEREVWIILFNKWLERYVCGMS